MKHSRLFTLRLTASSLLISALAVLCRGAEFPGERWSRATPAEAGLDEAKLLAARDYALTGGGSGYIIRGGKLVLSWGDPAQRYDLKSTTKSFGAAALGLAIKDGKMKLSDKARAHHSTFGTPPDSNAATGWLDEITIRHLATQTAGFDKPGGYVPLLFKPGTEWAYSDSGPNWLAECITLAYRRDLNDLMFERVFTPIGIRPADLVWRKNSYRPDLIDGIKRREFGAGISASVDAMARFGLLWLRGGEWNGTQILPCEFIDQARTPLPGVPGLKVRVPEDYGHASNHYGLLWWTNADGTIHGLPRDTYWTWGLYDSLIVVMPSLDMVVARAGQSWKRTDGAEHYDVLKPFLVSIAQAASTRTEVALRDGHWTINGRPTNPGSAAEGLLMNVRMVNATFEDRNKPDFDADANTDELIAKLADYKAHGVNAFTLCLQGGMPGYEGAVNSAFNPDGSLRPDYLARVERVIRACDRQGLAVILGLYYQRQSKILRDETAVRAGVVNAARWIQASGFRNVLLEIANEFPHRGFVHPIIRDPNGQVELIGLAHKTALGLLVTASGYGDGLIHPEVAQACDFLTPHWNSTKVEQIPGRLAVLKKFGKPIVVNEDDKVGEQAVAAMRATVAGGASHGLMLQKHNQTTPFDFDGAADDPTYYAALRAITSQPRGKRSTSSYFPPPDAEGGWRTPTSVDEIRLKADMDVAKLDEAFKFIQGSTKNGGLLVVRRGWLVYERYFGRGHHEALANLASCGKSFTSIAVGMLMEERPDLFPDGLDQKVFTPRHMPPEAFPLSEERRADIRLGQLLAFTAGIRGNNPCYVYGKETTIRPVGPDGWQAKIDDLAFGKQDGVMGGVPISTRTLWCNPGEGYSYASSSIHLASIMLRHVTGMELEDYLQKRLARPLGWGRWGFGYKDHPELAHTPGGGGIVLRPTDMLRFGYLLLNQGRWNDKQLVPADYVRHCAHRSPYNPHYPYSLQFNVNSGGEIAELPRDAFWKSGSGGHAIYVVPSLDLVVWKLGGRDDQYSPRNTGLNMHPDAARAADPRADWNQTVEQTAALHGTLRLVIAAINSAP